ncbi:hypothetical protein JTE90_010158 [Oedothorax gibbosus]|uniref:YqaJ viral recombinase domain-containing protein n=1 Tax=Oedothorax gibbosus TaxID=931172 RepID=A0AAV6TVK1_9ARAC|nr:hypothetical protein JTE90_010158 [Oedothorax gibbosus]
MLLPFWHGYSAEDAAVTSTTCYWRKSELSSVGRGLKFMKTSESGKKAVRHLPASDGSAREEFTELYASKGIFDTQLTAYTSPVVGIKELPLHYLHSAHKNTGAVISPSGFNEFAKTQLLPDICQKAEKATCLQADTPLWHELRYGRITASKLNAAAHCHTLDGSLEQILGARVKETEAMKRGTRLEQAVKMALSMKLECKVLDYGFLLDQEFPVFGASPDGVSADFTVEINCPVSSQTEKGEDPVGGDQLIHVVLYIYQDCELCV